MSARRLHVLLRQLPGDSALSRALNEGRPQWTNTDHLIADLWKLWANQDHPDRLAMAAKAAADAKVSRIAELKARFEKRKRIYGLGVVT